MKQEKQTRKEISNKKAIIVIVVTFVLLIALGVIYAIIFNKEDKCNNIIIKNYSLEPAQGAMSPEDAKPIIYLYPTEEIEVTIKVENPQNLTHTYPKYENEWKVIAKQNSDLTDCKTGRNLYALYWEGINTLEANMTEGFVIKGEDTIPFLEEKLKILGLNEREANEFIIYWLPQLENSKYNFIRFQTIEEINKNMALEITPKPDTLIRVMMEWKSIEEYKEVEEQQLQTPTREGFTVVEWGGTEIK